MRIGLITGEYPPMRGGIATQVHILARELAERGHSVHVMTDKRGNAHQDRINLHPSITGWGINAVRGLIDWARQNELDLLNIHYQTAAYGMSPWIHFLPEFVRPFPLITTFHDLRFPYLFPKAGSLRPWIVNRLARTSDGVTATNQEDHIHLQSVNKHNRLIPIGSSITTDSSSDANARRFIGADVDDFVIAFFGFVNHSKGLDMLIQSIADLREKGIPAKLLMIGDRTGTADATNAAYSTEIDRLVADCDLGEMIRWTGFVEDADLKAYLQTTDVVVLPYRDGASYRRSSLTTAIDAGAAVVTTTPAVNVPTFRDRENMRLVTPNDTAALTNALRELYNNPPRLASLRRGALILRHEFGWARITDAYIDFYRQVTEESV
ncbi:MAG: glycosyltransferase family 4 protein [Chloroflexota bacterium]